MPKTIISDTSCLIVLTNIGALDLLEKLYGQVLTTSEVAFEYGQTLPGWIKIQDSKDKNYQQILELEIDRGEASAISLALTIDDAVIIIDDYRGRKVATRLGLEVTGTIGIIIKSKLRGFIPSIKPLLNQIKATNFRLSLDLEVLALKEANE